MRITIQNKGAESSPIIIDVPNDRSEESFPVLNNRFFSFGTKQFRTVSDFASDSKVKETAKKVKEYCKEKGWVIIDEKEEPNYKKTVWTNLVKETSYYNRDKAKTETWVVVEGVPICILEFDEYKTRYDSNGNANGTYRDHHINAHIFLKKAGGNKIFSKQFATKLKLSANDTRTRK